MMLFYWNLGLGTCCLSAGVIPAATAEDVEIAVDAARRALSRNKGSGWASASGAVRAKYLRAIAAKVRAVNVAQAIVKTFQI